MKENVLDVLDFIIQDLSSKTAEERFDFFMDKSPRFREEIKRAELIVKQEESTEYSDNCESYYFEAERPIILIDNDKLLSCDIRNVIRKSKAGISKIELGDKVWADAA